MDHLRTKTHTVLDKHDKIDTTRHVESCLTENGVKRNASALEGEAADEHSDYGFQCAECGSMFKSAPPLAAHWTLHHNACRSSMCGEQFPDPRDRQQHFAEKHDISTVPDRPFICTSCGTTFSVASYLIKKPHSIHSPEEKTV